MTRPALRGYWKETKRPIYSAALILPFFAIYHIGTLFLQATHINGADALIIRILSSFSVNTMFASALVLLACFVLWQVRSGASWKVDPVKLVAMFFESIAFAVLLFFIFGWLSVHLSRGAEVRPGPQSPLERLVLFCGAGIYEELVFRALLLGLIIFALKTFLNMKKKPAAAWAAITAAVLFSLFHYIGPAGDPFSIASLLQRTLGGIYFSALFVTRGFGVTAATHALYDILVDLVLR